MKALILALLMLPVIGGLFAQSIPVPTQAVFHKMGKFVRNTQNVSGIEYVGAGKGKWTFYKAGNNIVQLAATDSKGPWDRANLIITSITNAKDKEGNKVVILSGKNQSGADFTLSYDYCKDGVNVDHICWQFVQTGDGMMFQN